MDRREIANLCYDAWMHRAGDMSDVPLAADFLVPRTVASFNARPGTGRWPPRQARRCGASGCGTSSPTGDLVCSVVDWEMAPVDGVLTAAEILQIRDGKIVRGEPIYDVERLRKAMSPGA